MTNETTQTSTARDAGQETLEIPPLAVPGNPAYNRGRFEINEKRLIDDRDGSEYVRVIPSFIPDCGATGSLRFACWEYSVADGEAARYKAIANALAAARQTMAAFAALASNPTL